LIGCRFNSGLVQPFRLGRDLARAYAPNGYDSRNVFLRSVIDNINQVIAGALLGMTGAKYNYRDFYCTDDVHCDPPHNERPYQAVSVGNSWFMTDRAGNQLRLDDANVPFCCTAA
jgi:hypothetical protein